MRDARIRRTSLASSPSPIRVTAGERRGLPADLVEEASHRLGIAALLYSACYFLAYGSSFLASDRFYFATVPTVAGVLLSHVVAAISILVSLLIFVVSRSGKLSAAVLCEVGLFYEVAGAVGIDFHLTWMPITPDMTYGGISWVCVWMVLFVSDRPQYAWENFVGGAGDGFSDATLAAHRHGQGDGGSLAGPGRPTQCPKLSVCLHGLHWRPDYLSAGLPGD